MIAATDGSPIRFWYDRLDWEQVCQAAGVREIRIHDLRHTAATALLELGEDTRSLMPLFGWASMEEVERYAHVTPVVRRRIADTQAQLFTGEVPFADSAGERAGGADAERGSHEQGESSAA